MTSRQLVSAAEAIEKLSAAAAAGQDTIEDFTDPVSIIFIFIFIVVILAIIVIVVITVTIVKIQSRSLPTR